MEILKMTKEELIRDGNISVRNALADMFMILNSKNQMLTKRGDDLLFSDSLECSPECSTLLFGDEDGANNTIENILKPQEEDDYIVIKCTKTDPDSGNTVQTTDILSLDGFKSDMVMDDDGCDETQSDDIMSLDDAIEHAREAAAKMREDNPDCSCAKEHEQLADWLMELKSLKDLKGDSTDDAS